VVPGGFCPGITLPGLRLSNANLERWAACIVHANLVEQKSFGRFCALDSSWRPHKVRRRRTINGGSPNNFHDVKQLEAGAKPE
jgi:hypothetical protein